MNDREFCAELIGLREAGFREGYAQALIDFFEGLGIEDVDLAPTLAQAVSEFRARHANDTTAKIARGEPIG